MAVIPGSEYKEFELMGNHMLGLATRGRGAQEVPVWRGRSDPGAATPPHYHDHEEVIVILSGSGKVKIQGNQVLASSGDVVIVPSHTHHELAADDQGRGSMRSLFFRPEPKHIFRMERNSSSHGPRNLSDYVDAKQYRSRAEDSRIKERRFTPPGNNWTQTPPKTIYYGTGTNQHLQDFCRSLDLAIRVRV
jgi:quercetin dioxygenase-like cupin family protein